MEKLLNKNNPKIFMEFCPNLLNEFGIKAQVIFKILNSYKFYQLNEEENNKIFVTTKKLLSTHTIKNKKCSNIFCTKD